MKTTAAILVGGEWIPMDLALLKLGEVRFLEGANQCDNCGYPLDGSDEGPNKLIARVWDRGGVKVLHAQVACQCGQCYTADIR